MDDKEQNEGGPYEATPHADLIAQILDCRVPKNEREWAAGREIERLTEMVDQLTHFIETNPVQLVADLRRELAEAQRDALRWWRYVDPYDMYEEDRDAWERYQALSAIDADMAEPKP